MKGYRVVGVAGTIRAYQGKHYPVGFYGKDDPRFADVEKLFGKVDFVGRVDDEKQSGRGVTTKAKTQSEPSSPVTKKGA